MSAILVWVSQERWRAIRIVIVEFLPNIHKIFGHIINYLLTSLVQSVLVKCNTSVFLHGCRLAVLARSVLKTLV